jgi:hypothetical protein
MTAPVLDLYEIAFLAGGPDRVVDTAVVALVETGRVRIPSPGQLAVADPARRHPVEGAVLDAIGTQGHRSIDMIVWRLAGDDRVREIGRRLTAAGLLRRTPAWLGRDGRRSVPTAAGKRALRDLVATRPTDPAQDGGSAFLVAMHGREHTDDALLRAALFEAFPTPSAKERAEGLRRRINDARVHHPGGGGGDGGGGGGGGDGGGGG